MRSGWGNNRKALGGRGEHEDGVIKPRIENIREPGKKNITAYSSIINEATTRINL